MEVRVKVHVICIHFNQKVLNAYFGTPNSPEHDEYFLPDNEYF